ncbi:uncharacterized protein K02A2.6-like [Culex quinquefasciatus]|nr:uncharacterized protein K02A2.6-like [Culex quinquefasciatus]
MLNIAGSIRVRVKCDGRSYTMTLIVIDGKSTFHPLLGRDWLDVLYPEWRQFFENEVAEVDQSEVKLDSTRATLLSNLNARYHDLFTKNLEEPIETFEASVVLKEDARPIFYRPYEVPFALKEKVSSELDRLVREKILVPVKHSEWASPIVVVPKADGSVRICMDCKVTVNKAICTEHYPLPNISDVFANLSGYRYFAKIDLQGAYMQVRVSEDSQKYLVINTHKGLFAYQRLPFGISNAASAFQFIMTEGILKGVEGVQCYLDDILLGNETVEGLVDKIHEVLGRLKEFKVKVNLEKSEFLVKKIAYLGHQVSEKGLSPSEEKVKAIVDAPRPKDVSQLKSFLGMINYYSKFVPNLSVKLCPLYALLKKNVQFKWSAECESAFDKCKKLLLSHRLLELYNPDLPIVVVCDASLNGVGAVLCHRVGDVEKPVFYASSTLSAAERNYPNLHREALAVVFALTKFFKYIYGKQFTVVTDNKPLAAILDQKRGLPPLAAARLQKYVYLLSIFEFGIVYRKGSKIPNADALSRLPVSGTTGVDSEIAELLSVTEESAMIDLEVIGRETQRDSLLSTLFQLVQSGWDESNVPADLKFYFANQSCLSLFNDCVLYSEKVIVPRSCQKRVLELMHGCHLGVIRMKQEARRYVYWPGLDKDIEEFVQRCEVCSKTGRMPKKVYSKWPEASRPFERVHLDFFHFAGKTFLIVVDAYSKWIDVRLMSRTDSDSLINALNSVFRIFGKSDLIVSDNGPPFNSQAFVDYARQMRIELKKSPAYSPESNGLAERGVQTAKSGLKKLMADPKYGSCKIPELVEVFLFSYRNSYCQALGCSPASKIFSFVPKTELDSNLKPKQEKVKKRVRFDLRVKEKVIDKRESVNEKPRVRKNDDYAVGDLVWYRCEYKTMRSWLEAVIVGVNSKNTYYIEVSVEE